MAGSADGAMGILDRHVIYLLADGITIEPLSGPPVAGQPQQHRGSRWPELDRERDVGEILARIEAVDAHLDEAAPWQFRENPVANRWRRVTKVCEESGEVWRALSGWDGENPRKGACGSRDELLAELGDTAVAALLAIQSLVKNLSQTWAVFLAALDKARGRVLDHQARGGPALPPESGTAGQAAYDNGITG
jgi:hypothetical protein